MIERSKVLIAVIVVAISSLWSVAHGQTRANAVELSAVIFDDPLRFELTWTEDASAPEYQLFKKLQAAPEWGEALVVLDGSATSFVDDDVSPALVYEYSLRKVPFALEHSFEVLDAETEMVFTIRDEWGDGMCCHHGIGTYEVSCCDFVVAGGGDFDVSESTTFSTGEAGATCTEGKVSLAFDYYGNETSWEIVDEQTSTRVAAGGPYSVPRFGTIATGIAIPAVEHRGTVLLLVEQSVADPLESELERLRLDLVGDGYRVRRREVSAHDEVTAVKQLILDEHAADAEIDTLFLLGHVPVPYSGRVVSGHTDHIGAWPADLYYGELDAEWTDATVTTTSADRPANHNVPGDGKFDQTLLPSDVDLQVGRVDLSNLPAFSEGEVELLRRYLDKNHAYRTGASAHERRAVIDDRVGSISGFAPAATGWRNFTPMFGPENVVAGALFPRLESESFMWSYGCAGSWYTNCGLIVSTAQLASTPMRAVFTALFGSYFGDWDNQDNVLRAPLAAEGDALVCFWAGRPTWHLQHMALGYPIGFSARLTQNNVNDYAPGEGSRGIHIALMGDPTLRMHVVGAVTEIEAKRQINGEVRLSWPPVVDEVEGYLVYRSPGINDPFVRLGDRVEGTTYSDPSPLVGDAFYMVRAIKLETSASGSYSNLSCGAVTAYSADRGPRRPGGRFGG